MRSGRRKWLCLLSFLCELLCNCVGGEGEAVIVKVGVVLDLNSTVGQMSKTSIQLAFSDFYTANPKYKTRLSLLFKDAGNNVVGAASAAMELLEDKVEAIIGPQNSEQAAFLAEFGKKYEIPVISFSATSPSLSSSQNPYFIRAAQSDLAQVEAINAIIQNYGWQDIVPIYEDTQFGRGIIPYLADLQVNGTRFGAIIIIPHSATEPEISKQLQRMKHMRKRIFLLHVTAFVGSKVFIVAQREGMMSPGYAWIVTDALSSLLDPITDSQALDSMQGIVGVRPYIPRTEKLQHFQTRFNKLLPLPTGMPIAASVNFFAVQAYDTVWALGMAVEKVKSKGGSGVADAIANTKLEGIGGDFHLVNGELKVKGASFEVFNVVGETERIIGTWTRTHNKEGVVTKQPIWPGDSIKTPRINLTIGIPVKPGFTEFIQVDNNDPQNSSGFCIDLFKSAIDLLPFRIDYTFVPFANESGESNGTYDQLLRQIENQKVDAVVGDITIIAYRSEFVDFTSPYSESGVSMLVNTTSDRKNMWIFLRPFKWDLWLLSFISFVITGFVVWLLECSVNTDFGGGPPQQQIGFIFWFSFSTLVFAHRERILNNLSRFLLIIWVFVVLILTQSYTANLSSMLTVRRLKPSFDDANVIREKGYFVGFQNGSFVRELLITQLRFNETKLRSYRSPDEFEDALTKGTDNGGVAAIFDEIPYIKVFLSKKSRSGFQMVGPIYRTGGFGFAFPTGSPLVRYFSKALLDVTEDPKKMPTIEQKYFSIPGVQIAEPDDSRLDAYSFGGLFIITAVATFSSLFIYLTQFFHSHWPDSGTVHSDSPLTSKMVEMGKRFYNEHFRSSSLQTSESRFHPEIAETTTPQTDPDHSNSTEQAQNLSVVNEDQTPARERNAQSIATN